MGLFPKRHFRWTEPKAFVKLHDAFERARKRWWKRPLYVLIFTLVLTANYLLMGLLPRQPQVPLGLLIPVSLALGIFLI